MNEGCVPAGQGALAVPERSYVSNYGDANATVRSDIRVQVGKLTDEPRTVQVSAILQRAG
jgi:hypothetical protein